MAILVYDFTGSPPTFGMPSGGSLIFGLAVALFAVIGVKLLQRVYAALLSPLAKIPGPGWNRFTYWPISLNNMKGERVMYLEKLYYQYGPIVRVGPNEVSVNDLASLKEIQRVGSGYLKTKWYELSTGEDGNPGMFAMTESKDHAARRKMFSKQFSKNGVLEWQEQIQEKFDLAVRGMEKFQVDGKVDLMVWWAYLATDLIGEMAFGETFGTLEQGKTSQYIADMNQTSFIAGLRAEFPSVVRFLWEMPIPSIVEMKKATARVQQVGREAFLRYRQTEKAGSGKRTIFTPLGDTIDEVLAENESKNLLIAGTDTTMVTLTYLVWILIKHPEIKQRVLEEIATLDEHYSIAEAEALPYLANVLQESLRLYGAGPGSLPRAVPKGGRVLAGHFVPEGTTVSIQAYVLHREAKIFPDPLAFKPERWENPTQAMKDAFMPFGGGTRVCLGMHLARIEMLLGAVSFFKAFPHATIAPETNDESMAFQNYFLVAPISYHCWISLNSSDSVKL